MVARPVALPETFSGGGSKQSFSDWVDHFDSVAEVNGWDEAAQVLWIRASLIGRAATAFKRLGAAEKGMYAHIVEALKKRFEPECRKEVYMAEFQARIKQRSEDWASCGEDLRTLVEKAYPTLVAEAQQLLALNKFLASITDVQLAFGVRQRAPANLDAAVAAAMELETYLQPRSIPISLVLQPVELDLPPMTVNSAATKPRGGSDPLQKILERMDQLEQKLEATREHNPRSNGSRRPRSKKSIVCWNCKEEGHFRRDCTAPPATETGEQGNGKPEGQ